MTGAISGTPQQSGPTLNTNKPSRLRVSFRGTLAYEFSIVKALGIPAADEKYLFNLLLSNDPNIEAFNENGYLVLGRKSERGMFSPDW